MGNIKTHNEPGAAYAVPLGTEMDAFNELPWQLRRALNERVHKYSAAECADLLRTNGGKVMHVLARLALSDHVSK